MSCFFLLSFSQGILGAASNDVLVWTVSFFVTKNGASAHQKVVGPIMNPFSYVVFKATKIDAKLRDLHGFTHKNHDSPILGLEFTMISP